MQKDEDEIALVRQAIKITDDALKFVMKNLKPGCTEYQAQADFEYKIFHEGADGTAFPTIAEAAQTERCCTTIPTAMYARMRHCC
jgi:Xaa-Pro aminopeptidase